MRLASHSRRVVVALITLALSAVGAPPIAHATDGPVLELITASDQVKYVKWRPNEPVWLDLGAHIGVSGSTFEIKVRRDGYSGPFSVIQVFEDGSTRELPSWTVRHLGKGFANFFTVKVKRKNEVLASWSRGFCPNSWGPVRIDPDAPDIVRFPYDCGYSQIALGSTWGIDHGYAAPVPMGQRRLADGMYNVRISIDPAYAALFDITERVRVVQLKVKTQRERDHGPPVLWEDTEGQSRSSVDEEPNDPAGANETTESRPDLVAGPAFNIQTTREDGRDLLAFAATIWNAGPANLVVDGFRRRGETLMDAYQSFYANGVKVGTQPAGSLEYDPRPGHMHWHFQDFAMYRLLDETQSNAIVSEKEAFCLVPTDAVDLTVEGAVYRPETIGFGTSCGDERSLSLREVLPTGWGDTYFQSIPGQSFDITDVPNGTYYIEVETNVLGRLAEVTDENNRTVRQVTLGGMSGARTVVSAPYLGLKI